MSTPARQPLVTVEAQVSPERLTALGVFHWPIWTKEVSEFAWFYGEPETCYLLAGEVIVTPDQGEAVHFGQGDLVFFPAGLSCRWQILKAVRKHYTFGA